MKTLLKNPKFVGPLAALAIAGCSLMQFLGLQGEPPRLFPHKTCGTDQKLECKECHPGGENQPRAEMPKIEVCMRCHEKIDADKPVEKRVKTIYGDKPQWSSFTSLPDVVVFSHQAHFEKKVKCLDCHVRIDQNMAVTKDERMSMDGCVACHAAQNRARQCEVCHVVISKDWVPPNHGTNWKREHGLAVKANEVPPYWNRCSLCHSESACTKCHQDEPPRNHTNFWRLEGHTVGASIDRSSCATCHRADFCDRCHRSTRPRSHTGSWGSPQERHCYGCHFPVSGERCFLCHKELRGHRLAKPLPAGHNTAMDCRQCHGPGLGQPLPHPDAGDDCTNCHF